MKNEPTPFSRRTLVLLALAGLGASTALLEVGQRLEASRQVPAPNTANVGDWRSKVGQATAEELAARQPKLAAPTPASAAPTAESTLTTGKDFSDPTACARAGSCSAAEFQLNQDAYWAEQNRREAEKRADCRAGRIDRDTCDRLVWDWETRI